MHHHLLQKLLLTNTAICDYTTINSPLINIVILWESVDHLQWSAAQSPIWGVITKVCIHSCSVMSCYTYSCTFLANVVLHMMTWSLQYVVGFRGQRYMELWNTIYQSNYYYYYECTWILWLEWLISYIIITIIITQMYVCVSTFKDMTYLFIYSIIFMYFNSLMTVV